LVCRRGPNWTALGVSQARTDEYLRDNSHCELGSKKAELTLLEVNGSAWWTFGFETIGELDQVEDDLPRR
jgi:hypothetical protein